MITPRIPEIFIFLALTSKLVLETGAPFKIK